MEYFKINGGQPLSGTLDVQGSKNEALMIVIATLLASGTSFIENVPKVLDIDNLIKLLELLGANIKRKENILEIDTSKIFLADYLANDSTYLNKYKQLRGSLPIAAALLCRFGESIISKPGGDKIGRRSITTHLFAFKAFGVNIEFLKTESYLLAANSFVAADIILPEASVTASVTAIFLAVFAHGESSIYNAACEPHIQQLCRMLNAMGANISGIGTNRLRIVGGSCLKPVTHRIMPDMIEVASFIALAATTNSLLTINLADKSFCPIILKPFEAIGVSIEHVQEGLLVDGSREYCVQKSLEHELLCVCDAPWPGIPTDLISVFLIAALQAKGNVLIHQKMYESRLFFVDHLIEMGAQIVLCDPHRVVVMGLAKLYKLKSIELPSPDIRAGMAMLIAMISAKGESRMFNIRHIDRGYELIEHRFKKIGVEIQRIVE